MHDDQAVWSAADAALRVHAPKILRAAGHEAAAAKLEALPRARGEKTIERAVGGARIATADLRGLDAEQLAALREAIDAVYFLGGKSGDLGATRACLRDFADAARECGVSL